MIDRSKELVHERDRLVDRVADLERQLTAVTIAQIKHRHWVTVTCDRCKTSITLSTSTSAHDAEVCFALGQAAIALRWALSAATADGLHCPGAVRHLTRDHCPACAALFDDS